MDSAQLRDLLRRVSDMETVCARLRGDQDSLSRRTDDLEESYGAQVAHISIEWRRFDQALKDIQDSDARRNDLVDRMFDLENQRHEVTIQELKRVSKQLAEIQDYQWKETTGLRNLDELQSKARSITPPAFKSPAAGPPTKVVSAPPTSKKDPWHMVKIIGAITGMIVALGGLATAIKECSSKVRIETIGK
jgi:hypothetical protein